MSQEPRQDYDFHPRAVAKPRFMAVPVLPQLVILALALGVLFGISVAPRIWSNLSASKDINPTATVLATPPATPTRQATAFAGLNLKAQAAFVWDMRARRVLYQKNADQSRPLASLTKLMTALLARELLAENTVTVSQAAINQEGASGLRKEERFTVAGISDLMLLTSSNDGAYALAETVGRQLNAKKPAEAFVALMNVRADELGLTQTWFRNPTGLDISETDTGGVGSARDMAFLMEYILKTEPAIIEATAKPTHTIVSQNEITHTAQNTNQDIIAVDGVIGSKTGYTTLAQGNLVLAFDAAVNRPVVAVVLGSRWEGRFTDMAAVITAVKETF